MSLKRKGSPSILRMKQHDEDDEGCGQVVPVIPIEVLTALATGHNPDLEDKGVLFLEDDISKHSLSRLTRKLVALHFDDDFKDWIQLIINSPGGYCDAGWALIDLMAWCKNPIRTIAMGEICSMATSIFIAGDDRMMSPNCSTMIHQFSDYGAGTYGDLIAKKKGWEIEMSKEIAHLIRCSKYKTEAEVKKNILKAHDHWLSPQEMKKHGLCDSVFIPQPRGKKKKC